MTEPGRKSADMAPMLALSAALWLVALVPVAAADDDQPPAEPQAPPAKVETRHTVTLGGHPLDYRAVAETFGLVDQKDQPTASVFTITYLVDPPAGRSRPVAFVFNGGPGAAAVFLHLGGLGPKILDSPASGAVPSPPVRLIDNPSSWLLFTDLVFVDPVGTGFSRGRGKEDNPDKPFWGVRSDLNALGAVMRRWLSRHERWASPVHLVGESYGGLRAAALAHSLERDIGLTVSGLVMISPALDIELLHPDISNPMAAAFNLPSFAATAAALAGGPAPAEAGRAAEAFALSDYLIGLTALPGIVLPGNPLIARIAKTIGLPEEIVRRERGRVGSETFVRELRRDQGEILSKYDATVRRPTPANPWDDHAGDAILEPAAAAFTAAFDSYAADQLGYKTEQPYRVLWHQASQQWNWEGASGEGGLGIALASLQNTLLAHPETRVLIAGGRYDLVTPYLASRWLIDQLAVPAAVREAVRIRVYDGGHMMYMRPAPRAALAADAAEIFGPESNGKPR